jgi:copper(I)-binding protein
LVLAAVGAAAVLLSGCGAGQITQTATKESSIQGVNADAGLIKIRNAAIAFPDNAQEWSAGGSAPLTVTLVNVGLSDDKLVSVTAPNSAGFVSLSGTAPNAGESVGPTPKPATPSASSSPSVSSSPSSSPSVGASAGGPSAGASASGGPSASASAGASATPLPGGAPQQVQLNRTIPAASALTLTGSPEALVLQNLRTAIKPDDTVTVTFVFQNAGSVTVTLPVSTPLTPLPRTPESGVIVEP